MLTKEEAVSLLGGVKKELPDSPQTPEEILEAMKIAASNYYREAIATNCNTLMTSSAAFFQTCNLWK